MGIFNKLKNIFKGIVRAFSGDPRYVQHFDWDPSQGGGGGDVTKAYVDEHDTALHNEIVEASSELELQLNTKADKADTYTKSEVDTELATKADKSDTYTKTEVDTALNDKADKSDTYTKTEVDTELEKKLDKRITGVEVYSHSDGTQGGMEVKTTMPNTPTDDELITAKGVKTYVDDKDPLTWKYVGILGASSGSTLTVKDDWKELLIITRVTEGSSNYNLVNIVPKVGFTQGSPTGNVAMCGFNWNEAYNAKARIGINGTGDAMKVQVGYTNATGWSINGFYIYKR